MRLEKDKLNDNQKSSFFALHILIPIIKYSTKYFVDFTIYCSIAGCCNNVWFGILHISHLLCRDLNSEQIIHHGEVTSKFRG